MSSREEFEKTMAPLFEENLGMNPDPSVWHKNKNGSYLNPVLEQHFVTWQAARATPALPQGEIEKMYHALDWVLSDYEGMCTSNFPPSANWQLRIAKAREVMARSEPNSSKHDWQLQGSAGVWESYYKCSKCEKQARQDSDGKELAIDGCQPQALPQGVEEWMPILGTCLAIPMKLLDESQAKSNHGQTPARLKERGGISLSEAVAIAGKMKWRSLESKRALEILHDLSGMAIVPVEQVEKILPRIDAELQVIDAIIQCTQAMLPQETLDEIETSLALLQDIRAMLAAAKEKGE